MKNWILFIGFGLFAFAGNVNAQSCSHGKNTAQAQSCVKPSEAVLKAAASDPTIEMKTCKDGSVCFVKKTTDAQGNVASTDVKYDEATALFVSIPVEEATAETGSKNGKACSTSKACCKAKGTASKACCAKGSASKACCKAKGTASVAAPDDVAPASVQPTKSN